MKRAEEHLRQFADLDRFWIFRTQHTQPGVINYADALGKAWTLMEDDESLLEECLEVLALIGAPVFDEASAMQAHAKRIAGLR